MVGRKGQRLMSARHHEGVRRREVGHEEALCSIRLKALVRVAVVVVVHTKSHWRVLVIGCAGGVAREGFRGTCVVRYTAGYSGRVARAGDCDPLMHCPTLL